MIEFHGARDEKAVYGGGELKKRQCSPSIEHFMRDWAMRNSLGPNYIKTQPKRDTFVYKYGKDLEHGLVTLVVDSSIGHEWPVSTDNHPLKILFKIIQATTPNLDNTQPGRRPATFDATRVIIDFFQAHPLYSPMNVIVQRSPVSASGVSSIGSSVPSSIPASSFPGAAIHAATATSTPSSSPTAATTSGANDVDVSVGVFAVLFFNTLALLV